MVTKSLRPACTPVGTSYQSLASLNLEASQNMDELETRENQRKMVDVRRLELPIPACKAGALPPGLHAHEAQARLWHMIVRSSVSLQP